MSASEGELFDACTRAAAAGSWWRRGRPVLWLTSPYVRVGDRTWKPKTAREVYSGRQWGYSARQAGKIATALRPVLAARLEEMERYARGAAGISPEESAQ